MKLHTKNIFLVLGIFSSIFFIDRLTKMAALLFLNDTSLIIVPHIFSLRLVLNEDALFAHGWSAVLARLFFLFLLLFWKGTTYSGRLFFSMILSGALSNIIDVFRYDAVIDLIEIPGLTIFNIADGAIVIGCIGLLISLLYKKR